LPTVVARSWRLLAHDPDKVARLGTALDVPAIVAQLLVNRGLGSPEEARRFLDAPLNGLHPPGQLPGVDAAADLILATARAGRRICVYGDYDVDGLSGTALLLRGLRLLGADVDLYVPHRQEEGYGLHAEALGQLAEAGTDLVITVDCGIASVAEAAEARRLGLKLIITDHHEFKDQLPDASVLVHPRLPGTAYPFGRLSGSAVAFKLAWALAMQASGSPRVTPRFREYLLDSVALASLGVVADVVPLVDENRILVRHGLARLSDRTLPGLRALCATAKIPADAELRASDIGFKLAPRLNAAGRLGCARQVVELLTTTRDEQAFDLAQDLEETNLLRQGYERQTLSEARALIDRQGWQDDPAFVLASPSWHVGVIGIVAGRLAEQYARPSLLIALHPSDAKGTLAGLGVGSGRSVAGFALNEALAACGDLLVGHGGHPMAAGFRVRPDRITTLRERFCDFAAAHFPQGPPPPELILDAETPLSALTLGLVNDLDRLEPYGADNRRPVFLAGGLKVEGEPRKVGIGERHLSFRVRQHGTVLKAIAFGMADRLEELLSAGGACCLAFTPKLNEWQGYRSVDLEVADFQPGGRARLAEGPAKSPGN
jgi:single-stranded-DNA-specific exonuclease